MLAGANTFNDCFGSTRNPWNIQLSAGGSSGGSAVALAAGQVRLLYAWAECCVTTEALLQQP